MRREYKTENGKNTEEYWIDNDVKEVCIKNAKISTKRSQSKKQQKKENNQRKVQINKKEKINSKRKD